MANIYEITGSLLELQDMMASGEVDPEVIADTLEAVEGEFEDKAQAYACMMKNLEPLSNGLKEESDRLYKRAKSIDGNIDRMKRVLEEAMRITGKTKFKTNLFSFGIQNSRPSVIIKDESKVPQRFLIPQQPKVDKNAVKDFLDSLDSNDSCEWAELQKNEILRIR